MIPSGYFFPHNPNLGALRALAMSDVIGGVSTAHVLRTMDAARELAIDPDNFLRRRCRGTKERLGHRYRSSANVAAVREYAAIGIEHPWPV